MPLSRGRNDVGVQLDCTTTGSWWKSGADIPEATTNSNQVQARYEVGRHLHFWFHQTKCEQDGVGVRKGKGVVSLDGRC